VKRPWVMTLLAGAVAASCAASLAVTATPAVGAVTRAGGWGKAIEVPGLARLSAGNGGVLYLVSCSSPGDCAASGSYLDRLGDLQPFVVSERNGWWGAAIKVPGLASLNTGEQAGIMSLSCGSAGNCAAGGSYKNSSGRVRAFVVSEKNGTWGIAMRVPGVAALSGAGGTSLLDSVSCPSAGNCTVGGGYSRNGRWQAFVVSEKNGSWGTAIEVPGLAAMDAGAPVGVDSVSCASAGNCAVAGGYGDAPPLAFVVSEKNGSWGKAIDVPGLAALNAGASANVLSVSCESARKCAAGGLYQDKSDPDHQQAFVVSENNGTWDKAIEVPGSGALNVGGSAQVNSVSCTAAGYCAAVGYYTDQSGNNGAFIVSRT
jgi:hypothetical protein